MGQCNLSSHPFSATEALVLFKGFNLSVALKSIRKEDIISLVELSVRTRPKEDADAIRFETAKSLFIAKTPLQNLSKVERTSLNSLRARKQIVILPADKKNATVIVDKSQYVKKTSDLLQDGTYTPLACDPISKFER